jgi:hypothetical protein
MTIDMSLVVIGMADAMIALGDNGAGRQTVAKRGSKSVVAEMGLVIGDLDLMNQRRLRIETVARVEKRGAVIERVGGVSGIEMSTPCAMAESVESGTVELMAEVQREAKRLDPGVGHPQ